MVVSYESVKGIGGMRALDMSRRPWREVARGMAWGQHRGMPRGSVAHG